MERQEFHAMRQLEDHYWWFVIKRSFIKNTLKLIKFPKKSKILDIGCGTGKNLEMLSNYGSTYGIDPSNLAIKYCRQRGLSNLKKGSINALPYNSQSFDLVTLLDVLYHKNIKNDHQALKEIYRVLKPEGYLLITDMAHQFLYGPHDISMHARQRYSKKELISRVNQAGFKVKKSSYYFLTTFPILIINRFIKKIIYKNKSSSNVRLIPLLFNQLLIFIYRLEIEIYKYFSLPTGSSIIILAQK